MNEPLTPWGEAELAAEMAHEASKSVTTMTDAEWIALADEMLAAADFLQKLSAVVYGDRNADRVNWSAHELRTESKHVRAEGNTDE